MDFKEHLEMAKDPNNIPGIYNYCDSWCERCTFTSRCLNFKSRAKFEKEIERRRKEEENKAFWDEVNSAINDVRDLLDEAEEKNEDADSLFFEDMDDDESMKEHLEQRQKNILFH